MFENVGRNVLENFMKENSEVIVALMNGELCEVDTGDGVFDDLKVVDGVLQNNLYGPPKNYRVKGNAKFRKESLFDVSFKLEPFEDCSKLACNWLVACPTIGSVGIAIPCDCCVFHKYNCSSKRMTHKEVTSIAKNM